MQGGILTGGMSKTTYAGRDYDMGEGEGGGEAGWEGDLHRGDYDWGEGDYAAKEDYVNGTMSWGEGGLCREGTINWRGGLLRDYDEG